MSSLWFGVDFASQDEVASNFDHVSLQSWGLSKRTLDALLEYNAELTVGDVLRAEEDFEAIPGLGRKGFAEVAIKVGQLLEDMPWEDMTPPSGEQAPYSSWAAQNNDTNACGSDEYG